MVADDRSSPESQVEREKSLDRQIRAFHWVRLLAEIPSRLGGSMGEREAARRTEEWLREIGFEDVVAQDVSVPPARSARLTVDLALATLGVGWGGVVGCVLGAIAWLSFRREEVRGEPGLSRLRGRSRGQNVVARAGSPRPRTRVVLTAALDAPRAGGLFQPGLRRRSRARRRRDGGPLSLARIALGLGLATSFAGLLGAGGVLFGAVQTAVTGGLGLGFVLVVLWARASASRGANDNASGVAALLTCAEQLLSQLRTDGELYVVGTSASQADAAGMRALLDAHPEWRTDRTLFVHFDRLGGGRLHYLEREGVLRAQDYPPRLRELGRRIAEGGAFAEVTGADLVGETDGAVTAGRDLHALTVMALEADGSPLADHAPNDVAEALDLATVVRAADFAAAVVVASWRGESDPLALV